MVFPKQERAFGIFGVASIVVNFVIRFALAQGHRLYRAQLGESYALER